MSEFFHPERDIDKHGKKLPHWQQGEVMQFVTFRLADSFPQTKLRLWKEQRTIWLSHHPKPWTPPQEKEYHQRFTRSFENALDEGYGSCLFNDASNRLLLEQVLMSDQDRSAIHRAWVIMPNHVHLLFTPISPLGQLKIVERHFVPQDRDRLHLAEKLSRHAHPGYRSFHQRRPVHPQKSGQAPIRHLHPLAK